jgi:hypothetical protein
MKIQNTPGLQGVGPASGKGQSKSEAAEFKKLLDDRLRSITESSRVASINTVEQVAPSPNLRLEGLELTEKALDTLENFGATLGNKGVKSSDLEPFVDSLEEETTGLLSIRNQLPDDDPLAGLVDRVATVTFLESAKYRRGDYSA